MDKNDWVQLVSFLILFIFFLASMIEIARLRRDLEEQSDEFYRSLISPRIIEAEMEWTADLREVRDANRTTLPREDAGPPAKVYRPLLRGQKPGSWRPRTSTVFQKIDREED